MNEAERTDRRRVLAAGALLGLLALDVIWGFFATRVLSGVVVPGERAGASGSDQRLLDAVAMSFLIVFVATAGLWLIWQYAAHETLRQRSAPGVRRKPSVVGWWLVPIVGLFTAGFAVGEIVGAVPIPHWLPRRALRLLFAAWWMSVLLFTLSPRTIWDTGGPVAVALSTAATATFALASLFAFPLVWLLDRGIGTVIARPEHVPDRRDALTS